MRDSAAGVRRVEGVAPGRLDVLGGVADYSGSLVLQMPLSLCTRVTIEERGEPGLVFTSDHGPTAMLPFPGDEVVAAAAGDAASLRQWLDKHAAPRWVRYPLGCVALFAATWNWRPAGGLAFSITSDVPASMGVSSSAALEVATLRALESLGGCSFTGTSLARLAQRAENDVVGAPCGLMDQLASAHGRVGELLPILCRPDVLLEGVRLPSGVIAVGWPSGVRHAVADSPYATARTAAFMGKAILERALGRRLAYLTEARPADVASVGRDVVPDTLTGADFIGRHAAIDDPQSRIEPGRTYPVRAAARFAVEENARAGSLVGVLREAVPDDREAVLSMIGQALAKSHAGYSAIGLGCPETDAMVDAIAGLGPARGFYGARISGGGSGGTVVVVLHERALPELLTLADRMTASRTEGVRILR
jgi:L-arabinokinase